MLPFITCWSRGSVQGHGVTTRRLWYPGSLELQKPRARLVSSDMRHASICRRGSQGRGLQLALLHDSKATAKAEARGRDWGSMSKCATPVTCLPRLLLRDDRLATSPSVSVTTYLVHSSISPRVNGSLNKMFSIVASYFYPFYQSYFLCK